MGDLLKCASSNLLLLLKVDETKKPALCSAGFLTKSLCESLFYKHDFLVLNYRPNFSFNKINTT